MPVRTKLIAGNWKMNQTAIETERFLGRFHAEIGDAELLLCMPFTDLYLAEKYLFGTGVKWGAQNVYPADKGAFTGEISPQMLKETGCSYVICGHSERRQILGESDEFVGRKVKAVLANGMVPILCIGETLEEREQGRMEARLLEELEAGLSALSEKELLEMVIAYEPIWAIGSGKAANAADAESVCAFIRKVLKDLSSEETAEKVRILYGGSVTGENISSFLAEKDVDGALIGGASLKPEELLSIYKKVCE